MVERDTETQNRNTEGQGETERKIERHISQVFKKTQM